METFLLLVNDCKTSQKVIASFSSQKQYMLVSKTRQVINWHNRKNILSSSRGYLHTIPVCPLTESMSIKSKQ